MWPYHPELLERPVPRYTSYPTAAEFDAADAAFHEAGFASIEPGTPVSLYVHIPFCEKICWYCGCNTGAANRTKRLTAYLDALHAEIELVAARLGSGHPVTQIAFGGGSPNAVAPVDFVRLLDRLMIAFGAFEARLSVELDPRGLTDEWIATLGRTGVGQASLGVQTFDPAIQAAIGRIQPREEIARAVSGLRSAGVASLNFDMMYGLPGQDCTILEETLAEAVALGPDRIALFGYAHLPGQIPRQRRIDDTALPDSAARFAMAGQGYRQLCAAGYRPIGFDHFALPGDPLARAAERGAVRRNFQGFTDDPADILIGIGASAISSFPDRFVQNEKNAGRYRMRAAAGRLAGARGVGRSGDDLLREGVIASLLCNGRARVAPELVQPANRLLIEEMRALGLVELSDDVLSITENGRPYARIVASLFDAYRNAAETRFSSAV